ncbi:glycine-rich RNA-binding protein 4, mitochondrial-like [Lycium barbarum]|uniref:glycine-rich RNA-binding protein 4, mitochondrial-like n=1 Tax=Lycium barbarum TaxID=112863 RepID=UPI00293EC814|nr:glycine-rich RNA-binding protein 4, mitochondrial-like [Lycium barbarum]
MRSHVQILVAQSLGNFFPYVQVSVDRVIRYLCWWEVVKSFHEFLFLSGLCYDTNEPVLKQAFEQHGETIEVKVICNHKSGKSKGYGFVKFTSETAATKALKEMDGQLLDGRNIRISYAHKE